MGTASPRDAFFQEFWLIIFSRDSPDICHRERDNMMTLFSTQQEQTCKEVLRFTVWKDKCFNLSCSCRCQFRKEMISSYGFLIIWFWTTTIRRGEMRGGTGLNSDKGGSRGWSLRRLVRRTTEWDYFTSRWYYSKILPGRNCTSWEWELNLPVDLQCKVWGVFLVLPEGGGGRERGGGGEIWNLSGEQWDVDGWTGGGHGVVRTLVRRQTAMRGWGDTSRLETLRDDSLCLQV